VDGRFASLSKAREYHSRKQCIVIMTGTTIVLNNLIAQALGLKPWTSSTIIDSVAREAMRAIKSVDADDISAEMFFDVLKHSGKLAGLLKGLPAQQAINVIEGVNQILDANNGEDALKGFKRVAGWSEYVVDAGESGKGAF